MNNEQQSWLPLVVVVAAVYLFSSGGDGIKCDGIPVGPKPPAVGTRDPLPAPRSPAVLSAADRLRLALGTSPDKALALEEFYRAAIQIVPTRLVSTVAFREQHRRALEVYVVTERISDPPVGAEIDAVLSAALGVDNSAVPAIALTPEQRQQIEDGLRAIAWACQEARAPTPNR